MARRGEGPLTRNGCGGSVQEDGGGEILEREKSAIIGLEENLLFIFIFISNISLKGKRGEQSHGSQILNKLRYNRQTTKMVRNTTLIKREAAQQAISCIKKFALLGEKLKGQALNKEAILLDSEQIASIFQGQ